MYYLIKTHMNKSNKKQPPAGQVRQSQILSTFGPGSMVDLPMRMKLEQDLGIRQAKNDSKRYLRGCYCFFIGQIHC